MKALRLNSSAIVLLDSVASLETFNDRTSVPGTFSTKQQLFIHCQDGTFNKIANIDVTERTLLMGITQYEYFVVEEENSIRLLTFVWYSPEKCKSSQLVEVNSFDKPSRRWQHENFRIDKSSDFYGCRINFMSRVGSPDFYHKEIDVKNREITRCGGFVCAIIEDFSSALNYKYHMNLFLDPGRSEPYQMLWSDIPFEVSMVCEPLSKKVTADPNGHGVVTRPIYYLEHFISVPPGAEFNGYEKLLLPFDEQTWMWIGITFGTAFATIFALRFVRQEISDFVMGKNTRTPVLNVLRGFFGISQIVCPGRNFARYLLMMFILFSLVIRTAYQGKMFKFLQTEIRKPTVTTLDEMIDEHFTFFMMDSFKVHFKGIDLAKRGNIIDDYTADELDEAFKRACTPGSKTAVTYNKDWFYHFIKVRMNKNKPPKLLNERYILESAGLAIPANHFLFDTLNRKLQQYIEADLVNYNARESEEANNPKKFEEYKEPFAVLTVAELEAGFVVCMAPLVFGIFIFAMEWLPTLKSLVVFVLIFKKLFDAKKLEQTWLLKIKIAQWKALLWVKQQKETETSECKI